jgi:hypothetical protein
VKRPRRDGPNLDEERLLMLVQAAGDDDPQRALMGAAALRREADRAQLLAVRRARHAGLSWSEIADHLGVSKQAAHRKYRGRPAKGTGGA